MPKVAGSSGPRDVVSLDSACKRCYDAIVVPGGGAQDEDGHIPAWTRRRLDAAVQVWQAHFESRGADVEPIVTLSGGTCHKPNYTDTEGYHVSEASASAKYLLGKGIPKQFILREWASYDTIGNAFFLRTFHTDITGWRKLLVINSDFHMPRTIEIFEWVYSMAPLVDAPYQLSFLSVSDAGLFQPDVFRDKQEREQLSLARLSATKQQITSLKELHSWIFLQHDAYAVGRTPERVIGPLQH